MWVVLDMVCVVVSVWFRFVLRFLMFLMLIESWMRLGVMLVVSCCLGVSWVCVVEVGWMMSECILLMLVRWLNSDRLFMNFWLVFILFLSLNDRMVLIFLGVYLFVLVYYGEEGRFE